jgi:hypothetical protein
MGYPQNDSHDRRRMDRTEKEPCINNKTISEETGETTMITLGKTYKDKITQFAGVATGLVQYITGCNQVLLAPPVGKDGNLGEARWLDEQRLEVTRAEQIVLDNGQTPGFDIPAPIK